jgi:hypothetical protein
MENNMKLYMVMLAVLRLDDIPNNMIFFLEFLERNSPEMKDFGQKPKDESTSMPGAK